MTNGIHKLSAVIFLILLLVAGCTSPETARENTPQAEVMYHVFQRSFYDSNADGHGDLTGLQLKLDYLQNLGVTSILLLPLYQSDYYHNYFASDFEKIDPEFGSMQDYLNLVQEIHKRGMKLYMDMETQYVTEDHVWFKDSYKNPSSLYSDYLVYNDSLNEEPESIIFDIKELPGYDGTVKKVTTVKLHSQKVLEYNISLFKRWVDPNGDGNFDDGVDGFRLDHMMDNLDWKNKFTNLFAEFWAPLLTQLKQVNPNLTIIAEQAEWASFGEEYFGKANVDRVFAFRLQQAIASFNKQSLINMADTTFLMTPAGKQQIIFIENHDMHRFASVVENVPGKLRVGAALNLLLGGVPSIYYGQEIGMNGQGGFNAFGTTDGNDIPRREAFEWYKTDNGQGMALWYKETGPWWDQRNLKANDGISLEEQKDDPASLWNYYKDFIALRKENAELSNGKYLSLSNDNDKVFSFLRQADESGIAVIVNLSDSPQQVLVDVSGKKVSGTEKLFGIAQTTVEANNIKIDLPAYGVEVLKLK